MMRFDEIIKSCPLFVGLDEASSKALADQAVIKSYAQESVIFSEGEDAESLYIVAEGSVDLIKSTPDGREQLVRQVNQREMFAEAAMFSGVAYPATAISRMDSKLIVITKPSFLTIVKNHPEVALAIMGTMAKLLRHLNKLVSDLSLGSVANRLARYLLQESSRQKNTSFELPIPKRELAFKLGTVPETLSRTLKKLASKGLVTVKGKRVLINNIKALEDNSKN